MTHSKTMLVLGTGATVGGGFKVLDDQDPPMDRGFFNAPATKSVFEKDRYPTLSHYQKEDDLEPTWAQLDLYHKLCLSGIVSEEKIYFDLAENIRRAAKTDQSYRLKMEDEDRRWCVPSMAGWELQRLLIEVFKDFKPPDPQEESPLYKLIERLQDEDLLGGVTTFNYDTSVERLFLGQFYYPLLPRQSSKEGFPLLKLHGSLNWQFHSKSDSPIIALEPDKVAELDYQNQSDYKQPEVIGPTFFKQEINMDTQLDPRGRFYKRTWALAWDMLRKVHNLVFVGFSFPKTDFHAAALFRTAHLSGSGFRRVVLCHYHDKCLRGTAEQVFAGKPTEFTEFDGGLENMADRLDELLGLLTS